MAEEGKKEGKNVVSTIFKFLLGVVFLALAVYLLLGRSWWRETLLVVKGCLGPFLILAGIITLAIAKE